MRFDEILARFPDAKKSGDGWTAKCPAHLDGSPSLSISEGHDGRTLLHCHAGCTPQAICTARGLKLADLFLPRSANAAPPDKPRIAATGETFNWQKCVENFNEGDGQKLAATRGLSSEFVRWIHTQGIVGIFEGKIAFANHGDGGAVVSAHVRLESGKWIFKPAGQKTAPLVFGDKNAGGFILAFESQWDAFAVMDKLGWHSSNGLPDTAIFITRGAGNGKLIHGQIAPDAVCYAFKQNDAPTAKNPIPAGDVWLAEIVSNAGCKVLNVATPAPHADANDWTRAGATKADLDAAMKAATPVQPQAAQVADSKRADIASEYLGGDVEPSANGLPDLIDAADFLALPIDPPAELIAGILHKGSKLVFGGSSKSYKTWSLLDLAISVATGTDWLGRATTQGKVLFVNFEIQSHQWQGRISKVSRAKGVELLHGKIILWNLRGHAADFKTLIPKIIERARRENFALIILDPIYKLYGNTDENSAGNVALLLNSLENLATETGAAIAFGAHFAKGNAAGKEAIDRISGSGVFARDPDSLLIFTKHETDDAFTVEPILRNFAPVPPFAVRWQFPLMHRDDDLDPTKLKQAGGRPAKHSPADLLALLPPDGLDNKAWIEAAAVKKISERTFYRLRGDLEKAGKVLESITAGKWLPIQSKSKAWLPKCQNHFSQCSQAFCPTLP